METTIGLFVAFILFFAYFLPSCVAYSRKAVNFQPILFLNVLLGWTIIIWLLCFVWSFVGKTKEDVDFEKQIRASMLRKD